MSEMFVTGGSGFVGRNVIAALRARGHAVRALARSDAAARAVQDAGAVPVCAELGDVAAMARGMAGCAAVFHAAAKVEDWGDAAEFHRVNVQGTRSVIDAARAAAVPVLVHVSTEAVLIGEGEHAIVRADERRPRAARPMGHYPRTKAQAEALVLAANDAGLRTVVVRPRFVWGAGDATVLPKMVEAVREGRFAWISGGRYATSTCHVRNAAEAIVLAAERGVGGEVYFATDGEAVEFRAFATELLATQGVDPGTRSVPRWLARAVAWVGEGIYRALGVKRAPPVLRVAVRLVGEEVTVDDAKARRELGYRNVVTREEGLAELRGVAAMPTPRPDSSPGFAPASA